MIARIPLSVSQFADLVGYDPQVVVGLEMDASSRTVTLLLAQEDEMNTSGTFPQLNTGKKPTKGKGGKRGC